MTTKEEMNKLIDIYMFENFTIPEDMSPEDLEALKAKRAEVVSDYYDDYRQSVIMEGPSIHYWIQYMANAAVDRFMERWWA